MNTPIFNPIWFYLIEMFERFGTAFLIVGGLALIGSGIAIFINLIEGDPVPKYVRKIVIAGAIVCIIGGLVPSKETCYKMIVASYVTPSNIETVKGEASDLIDYLVDKIDQLTDEGESD